MDYKKIEIDGEKVFEHRYVWEKVNGKIPEEKEIHHINGNKKDNRIENLMCLSKSKHMKLEQ